MSIVMTSSIRKNTISLRKEIVGHLVFPGHFGELDHVIHRSAALAAVASAYGLSLLAPRFLEARW